MTQATIQTEWANKPVYVCAKHYQQLAAVGRMLAGFSPPGTPYNGEETCKNCENEAKMTEL